MSRRTSSANYYMKAATVPTTAYNLLQRTRHVSRLRRTDNSVPEFTQVDWSRLDDPTVLQHTEYVQCRRDGVLQETTSQLTQHCHIIVV